MAGCHFQKKIFFNYKQKKMIKLQLIGHLGQDATVNDVNGRKVINFSVAHSEKYKNKEGAEVNRTTWASCAYWTDKVNLALYLKKGTQVYVDGYPEAKTYRNSNTNEVMPQLAVRVASIQLLSSGKPQTNNDFLSQPNGYEQTDEQPLF
jgi:single-strand DNA-binding protein